VKIQQTVTVCAMMGGRGQVGAWSSLCALSLVTVALIQVADASPISRISRRDHKHRSLRQRLLQREDVVKRWSTRHLARRGRNQTTRGRLTPFDKAWVAEYTTELGDALYEAVKVGRNSTDPVLAVPYCCGENAQLPPNPSAGQTLRESMAGIFPNAAVKSGRWHPGTVTVTHPVCPCPVRCEKNKCGCQNRMRDTTLDLNRPLADSVHMLIGQHQRGLSSVWFLYQCPGRSGDPQVLR
jgi:hypothetical protein